MLKREHRCEWRDQTDVLSRELDQVARELHQLKNDAAFEDPVTGVGNLHQLDRQFVKLVGRWRRTREPFCIALIAISDPRSEDLALPSVSAAHLARVLMETARLEDSVCRASQNEFAVLLSNATEEGAAAFATRTRNAFAREPVRTNEGSRFYRSTVGYAEWHDEVDSLASFLKLADQQMAVLSGEINLHAGAFLPD